MLCLAIIASKPSGSKYLAMAADAAKEAAKPIADPAQLQREHAVCLSNRDQALKSASARARRDRRERRAQKSARLSLSLPSLPAPRVQFLMDSLRKLGCEPGPIDEFIVCRRASDDKMTAGFVANHGNQAAYKPQASARARARGSSPPPPHPRGPPRPSAGPR